MGLHGSAEGLVPPARVPLLQQRRHAGWQAWNAFAFAIARLGAPGAAACTCWRLQCEAGSLVLQHAADSHIHARVRLKEGSKVYFGPAVAAAAFDASLLLRLLALAMLPSLLGLRERPALRC